MNSVTIEQINERLAELPPEKLNFVYSFVSSLVVERPLEGQSDAYQTMLASEAVLRRDWDQPEEDAAWADL